jgi:hypothetical protein
MSDCFGDFVGLLTEAFAAAALDARQRDAAMEGAARATGSFGRRAEARLNGASRRARIPARAMLA